MGHTFLLFAPPARSHQTQEVAAFCLFSSCPSPYPKAHYLLVQPLPLWVCSELMSWSPGNGTALGKGALNMATPAFTFVTLISGLNRLLAAGSAHQQVCQPWQGKDDVHTGLIGLGKEDGVSRCDTALSLPPTSHEGVPGPSWTPPEAPGEVRGLLIFWGPDFSVGGGQM